MVLKKIKSFLKFINNNTKVIDITKISESNVSEYLHSIEQTKDLKGRLRETSFSYRKQVYSILNSFFEYLLKRKLIYENPMEYIERPILNDVIKRKYLDSFDIHFLLECIDRMD